MYNNSSIENGWADLTQIYLIVRNCQERDFTKKIFGKTLYIYKYTS